MVSAATFASISAAEPGLVFLATSAMVFNCTESPAAASIIAATDSGIGAALAVPGIAVAANNTSIVFIFAYPLIFQQSTEITETPP